MKLNKVISRSLILSLFISNLNGKAFASGEIPNRYETLEGEYITIDDSTEGNLEEIEIFGNTIQDPNNLEDIQSVGDLYVDKNGKPILDSQGRKQYKINIVSTNYTHIKTDFSNIRGDRNDVSIDNLNKTIKLSKNRTQWYNSWFEIVLDTAIKKGDTINFSFQADKPINVLVGGFVSNTWYDKKNFSEVSNFTYNTVATSEFNVIRIQIDSPMDEEIVITQSNNKSSNTNILLPCQLQKVGDISDKLYWDNSRGRYVIEKNIREIILDGSEKQWVISGANTSQYPNIKRYWLKHTDEKLNNLKQYGRIMSNKIIANKVGDNNSITCSNGLDIHVLKSELISEDVNGIKNWLKNNNLSVKIPLIIPDLINTNITSKLKIPTYEGKTYIFVETEDGVSPTLKITVDKLLKVAKEAVAQAESDSTNHNISLARMYVNMLPESLYKDQLHEQLNQIFSSDVVLNKKSVTSNADIYIKSKNTLSMSLDTNSVMFEGYSGTEDMEMLNAVNITVDSSLPYSLNAYMPIGISNSDNSLSMNMNTLNIRESSETNYQVFTSTTDKVVLKDNCIEGTNKNHSIDLKLSSNQAHKADVYKTVIKFEAEQK